MKKFPEKLNPKYKDTFPNFWKKRVKCYLRREIYEHILSHTEDEYFSLDIFDKKINPKSDMKTVQTLAEELVQELKDLGWKCIFSYGNTGLFIYSTEKPPKTCWESETLS